MPNIIELDYSGHLLAYQDDGWFNATVAAERFGKRVDNWLRLGETQDYLAALCELTNTSKVRYLKTKRGQGGGTWLHPKLAVRFAQWLDPRFAVWCDTQIDNLLRDKTDWRRVRHEAAATYKMMSAMLQDMRKDAGKETGTHHYANEARLVNWVLSGEFKALDRNAMPIEGLDLLAHLEERNAVLIGRGLEYDKRKGMLQQYAYDWKMARSTKQLKGGQA